MFQLYSRDVAMLTLNNPTRCVGLRNNLSMLASFFLHSVHLYILHAVLLLCLSEWMDASTCVQSNKIKAEKYKGFPTLAWYTRFFKRGEWAWINTLLILQPADNNSWHVFVCALLRQLDYHTCTLMSLTNNRTIFNHPFLGCVARLLSLSAAFLYSGNISIPHIYSIFWPFWRGMDGGHSRKEMPDKAWGE